MDDLAALTNVSNLCISSSSLESNMKNNIFVISHQISLNVGLGQCFWSMISDHRIIIKNHLLLAWSRVQWLALAQISFTFLLSVTKEKQSYSEGHRWNCCVTWMSITCLADHHRISIVKFTTTSGKLCCPVFTRNKSDKMKQWDAGAEKCDIESEWWPLHCLAVTDNLSSEAEERLTITLQPALVEHTSRRGYRRSDWECWCRTGEVSSGWWWWHSASLISAMVCVSHYRLHSTRPRLRRRGPVPLNMVWCLEYLSWQYSLCLLSWASCYQR